MKTWTLYALACERAGEEVVYFGITLDPDRRLEEHRDGVGAKFTRSWRPLEMFVLIRGLEYQDALRLERLHKRSKRRKEFLLKYYGVTRWTK